MEHMEPEDFIKVRSDNVCIEHDMYLGCCIVCMT